MGHGTSAQSFSRLARATSSSGSTTGACVWCLWSLVRCNSDEELLDIYYHNIMYTYIYIYIIIAVMFAQSDSQNKDTLQCTHPVLLYIEIFKAPEVLILKLCTLADIINIYIYCNTSKQRGKSKIWRNSKKSTQVSKFIWFICVVFHWI